MTSHLRLLGFGAEVFTDARSTTTVREAETARGDKYHDVPITAYGTRHRAAFRFCSSEENAVAFVVSQDGGLKAVRQVGPHLTMWPYFQMGFGAVV
jgi:hypothetical protein